MLIGIISDTHDNLANTDKFLAFAKNNNIKSLIHCGDIASGETLEHIAKNFGGEFRAVMGNMDYRESVKAAALKFQKKFFFGKVSARQTLPELISVFPILKKRR